MRSRNLRRHAHMGRIRSSMRRWCLNPLIHGGGALYPPCGFCPFLQKIFRQPIPQNSLLFPTFYQDAPMKKQIQILGFTPAQSTFGAPSTKISLIIKHSSSICRLCSTFCLKLNQMHKLYFHRVLYLYISLNWNMGKTFIKRG